MRTERGSNNPHEYSEHSQPQIATAQELIDQFQAQFKTDDILVDMGCGTGAISVYLSKYVGKVYAFDISVKAIEFAKKAYPAAQYPNITFFTADAKNLTLPKRVDWVFSANALHWLSPQEQLLALSRIQSILKDTGKLILTFGMRHEPLWSIVDESVSSDQWSEYFNDFVNPRTFYTPTQYKKLLVKAGFEVLSIQSKPITYKFRDIATLLNFVKSWLPHVNCVPKDKRDEYMESIGEAYLRRSPAGEDGSVFMTFNILEIYAQKFFPTNQSNLDSSNRRFRSRL